MADEPILPVIQLKNNGEIDRSRKSLTYKLKQKEKEEQRNKKATAKKKKKSSGGSGGPLDFLVATNDWLEDCPERIVAAYDNFIGNGEGLVQSKVDKFCAWLAWKVNIAVERKRQAVLKILHEQYQTTAAGKVMKMANAIQSFVSDPLGALGTFAGAIFGPVTFVFKLITQLISEVIRLAANLARIMAVLPPNPPNPHINYDKFKLRVNSISMGEVMAGPGSLPSPEAMFPEPEKPFTKETFAKGFEEGTATLKSGRKKYKLSEEDKKALVGFDTRPLSETLQNETQSSIM